MKKSFAYIMSLLIISTMMLGACKPAASSGPVEIKYMMWGSPEELAVWQTIVNEFETSHPNIKVTVDVSDWDGYWEKLKVLYASNTPPDVFAMDAPLFRDWQSRGVLLDLQPYIDQKPGFLDGFYPQALQNYNIDGHYYGLPRDCQTIVMFYNKDMFDAANVAYPQANWTYDDFRQIASQLTKDNNGDGKTDQWGFGADLWDMELFWSEAIWAHGGDIISQDHTQTLIGDPQAREGWKFISDLVVTDQSMPNPDTAAQFGYDLYAAGVVAMWPMGHWAVPDYKAVEFQYDVAPMPVGPAGQATSINSAGFVVSKDSKNPEAAWEFIQFAMSETGQTRLTQLGFALPVLKSVAESDTFLKQDGYSMNQQVFIDSIAFAHVKPSFKGYDEWATIVGDGMNPVWLGEQELNTTLAEIVPAANEVLTKYNQ